MRVCTNPHIFFTYTLYDIVPCNNAKTNYFSFEEFKIIGNAIQQIQKHKLLKP